jgi:hypothetical protein
MRGLLKEQDINVLPWPPVDLSPIRNCFCEIHRKAKIKFGEITKDDKLWDYVSDIVIEDDFT